VTHRPCRLFRYLTSPKGRGRIEGGRMSVVDPGEGMKRTRFVRRLRHDIADAVRFDPEQNSHAQPRAFVDEAASEAASSGQSASFAAAWMVSISAAPLVVSPCAFLSPSR
jgi:hypothetical protein